MKRYFLLAALAIAGPALAQSNTVGQIGRPAPASGSQISGRDSSGNARAPLIDANGLMHTGGGQEAFQLATSNVASPAVTTYGGDYIISQVCSAYGTVAVQVLGPDKVTYQTILSKTAADTTGGTGLALGSNAVVQVLLSGTTGCNVQLSRVP